VPKTGQKAAQRVGGCGDLYWIVHRDLRVHFYAF
jgi:hypothetical protein